KAAGSHLVGRVPETHRQDTLQDVEHVVHVLVRVRWWARKSGSERRLRHEERSGGAVACRLKHDRRALASINPFSVARLVNCRAAHRFNNTPPSGCFSRTRWLASDAGTSNAVVSD